MMHYLLILLIGYLLGCSNMAVYLAAAQNVDLRSGGSKVGYHTGSAVCVFILHTAPWSARPSAPRLRD